MNVPASRASTTSPDAAVQALPESVTPERVTPMMAQYIEIKAVNADSLLFYRMGDFYELFFHDAEVASRALGITLTKRGKHDGRDIPMCGVPVVRADDYLQRLIALGHRVAVCEQLEDPAEARKRGGKSVVRRDVTRLITPGTVTEDALLDPGRANALLSVARMRHGSGADGWRYGLACVDISTGSFTVASCDGAGLASEVARFDPREIITPDSLVAAPELQPLWRARRTPVTPLPRESLDATAATRRLTDYFGVATLDGFGAYSRAELAAAAAALAYIERTQCGRRPELSPPARDTAAGAMALDAATRANLELTRTLAGDSAGSLLATIDRTRTGGGARLLAQRLAAPLTDPSAIDDRLDAVAVCVADPGLTRATRAVLSTVPDVMRALQRLSLDRGGPRDLAGIGRMLVLAQELTALLTFDRIGASRLLMTAAADLARADAALAARIDAALVEAPAMSARDGGFVRAGFDPEIDAARALRDESRRVVAALQARYAAQSGVKSLKIKHNNVLGYFVEVPQPAGEQLLKAGSFIHRQTMADAMRFTSAELAALEQDITTAAERVAAREMAVFAALSRAVLAISEPLRAVASALADIDVASALADLALDRDWHRPEMSADCAFRIEGGRHPVVEAALARDGAPFVANDADLSAAAGADAGRLALLTGPNMAGKSTFLRQNALMAVLAQTGSFVPAASARIGIVDRLFSRVGAADDLARGRSTFMVEMIETAAILHQATPRSFVILDEIGRGTATYDGLSIAWACLEHLHDVNRCRAIFATHFHELTELSARLPRLTNLMMRVTEWKGDVVFLHAVATGAADRSYGVQVAKLAGLPHGVIARARTILADLERAARDRPARRIADELPLFAAAAPVSAPSADALRTQLLALDPDALTPRDAQAALYALIDAARSG